MELSERKKAILKSVIDSYIRTGDPVGSKSLTESKQFSLSSATIRSEMNDLEAMGYLEQPHTSAGRIPTAQGYRTYVDSLMEKYFLGMEELEVLDEVMSGKMVEVGKLMDEAAKAIGQITNYATFAFMGGSGSAVDRYETVFVDENSFLLIMICKDGTIRNRHVKLMESITPDLLETAKKALNETLANLSADQINLTVILEFEEKMGEHRSFATTVLRVVHEMLGSYDREKVHIDGVTKLLSYPEFMNVAKFQSILSLFGGIQNLRNKVSFVIFLHNRAVIALREELHIEVLYRARLPKTKYGYRFAIITGNHHIVSNRLNFLRVAINGF